MNEFSNQNNKKNLSRDAIIGLGEASIRKNYYPELQQKIHDLEKTNARIKALISAIPDILFVSDNSGNITYSDFASNRNSFAEEILNNSEIKSLLAKAVLKLNEHTTFITEEFRLVKNYQINYFEARIQNSEIDEVLIMIRDMTDRITLENLLKEMANTDSLTGLYNRRKFEEKMNYFARKEFENVSITLFDINGLKIINDTLGHFPGDQAIVTVANRLMSAFSGYGTVARIGGDEFGILIEGINEHDLEVMIKSFINSTRDNLYITESIGIALSYGYAFHKKGIVNIEHLFQVADNNMYQNKLLSEGSIRSTFVNTFMKALEAKDYVSEGHVSRMEFYAEKMGASLDLTAAEIDRLILLTKFHDIGKIGIPDSILKKPSRLDHSEWEVMKTHSAIGERIARESTEIKEIAPLILKHHEKWDGSGYPLGLKGDEIPLECRILTIVDSYDAITNDRPYHKASSTEEAISEIIRCSGTQFEPRLVELFVSSIVPD